MFSKNDIQRVAVAAIGAIVVSSACVFGAVGPAYATAPAAADTVAKWQAKVQDQLDGAAPNVRMPKGKVGSVTLAARFTADGDYAGAGVTRSSGNAQLDQAAREVADHVSYPQMPMSYRGRPQTVLLSIYFGRDAGKIEDAIRRERIQLARRDAAGPASTQIAAR